MYYFMILGGADVRSDFSNCIFIDAPNGWLLNQKSSLLILFEKYKSSKSKNKKFYTHLFSANEYGEPYQLINTRIHSLECALETWNELIANGWTLVTNNFQ